MPIYEYRCADCGRTLEARQKFSDEPYTNCGQTTVECDSKGKGRIERLLSSPAFQFKGSGWYITDYAKGNGNSTSKNDSKSDGKSDSKPSTSSSSSGGDSSSSSSSSTPAASSSKND
jgi:putative FmdB family regulatory protein